MASGSFHVSTDNGYISGHVDWSSTANVAGNYSTVTATMYLSRTNTGYTTYGSGTMNLNVGGTIINKSGSWTITYNSNTLMVQVANVRVNHNTDGTGSCHIIWSGSMDSPLNIPQGDGWATLDTIPRASTATSNVSWTAGTQNLAVTLNVASSSFHHSLQIFVQHTGDGNYDQIGQRDNIGSSTTWVFTQAEITQIYTTNNMYENRPVILRVFTYDSSGNQIGGYQDKTGTVYAIPTATTTITGSLSTNNQFNIGDTLSYSLSSYTTGSTGGFTYDFTMTFGSFTKTWAALTAQTGTLALTSTDLTNIYAQIPTANSGVGSVKVQTKYNGVATENGAPTSDVTNFTAYVVNSNPTLAAGFTYQDNNSTTSTLTGNNQYIIQNYSDLLVNIPANGATAINGASMTTNGAHYEFTINGATKTLTYTATATTFDIGVINASANTNLTVKAVDSRGNSSTINLTVTIVPYTLPVVTASATRLNGFDVSTTLTLSGSASALSVNGTNKNSIKTAQYQYRQKGGTYNALTSFTIAGFPSYSATNVTLTLDNTLAWDINFVVTDQLGNTASVQSITAGSPIWFIDSVLDSVGIGKFPTGTGTFETLKDVIVGGNLSVNNTPYVTQLTATVPATAGWYRIATSPSGIANVMGEFEILCAQSSHHSYTKLVSGINYGDADCSLVQLSHSVYGTPSTGAITQARIVYNTTYSGNYAYLEVYWVNAASYPMTVKLVGGSGWTLVAPNTAGSVPSGYSSQTINLQTGGIVTSGKVFENGTTAVSPAGMISMFASTTAPTGWLVCDGSAVSRTTYANLFAAISTNYGTGDGSTTFNLPNLKGKVPVGMDSGQTEFASLNTQGGEKTHVLSTNEMPAHTHQTTALGGYYFYGGTGGNPASGSGYGTQSNTLRTDSQGGGVAHNNLQPYVTMNFIIKT